MIAVLGSGMAGCGALTRLKREGIDAVMFDMKSYVGGHTASFEYDSGFIFDEGPHISFTRDERIRALFAANVEDQYETIHAQVNNYWKGHWIKHPAQANLYGLPEDLLVDVLEQMIDAQYRETGPVENYEDWLVASFGRRFSETFPMQYGLKYHTTHAANMSTDWLGPRLYKPKLAEVLRGAVSPSTPDVHYVQEFRYPSRGGFVSYISPMLRDARVRLDHRVEHISPSSRTVRFSNGAVVQYDHLISSIPLPELIALVDGAPADVREAAGRLACSTLVLVNVGIDRDDISNSHWTYFYDDDFCFTRLSYPHLLSPHNVPPGCGSIQAELYFSNKYKPLTGRPEEWIEPTIRDLRRCGLLREDDRILFKNALLSPYANVIFDLDRAKAVEIVHGYLEDVGIHWCGRYGEWAYFWTDESFMSGERAAERVMEGLDVAAAP